MSKSKPVDELTIEDLRKHPIWEWAIDEEENEDQDETWVKPSKTNNFTEELNGSIVLGELTTNSVHKFPLMCSLDVDGNEAIISSVVFYDHKKDEYHAIEDVVKKIDLPLSLNISLKINGKSKLLEFQANKADIYKNEIITNF